MKAMRKHSETDQRHRLPTLSMAEARRQRYPFDGSRNVAPDPKLFGPPARQSGCRCMTCQP